MAKFELPIYGKDDEVVKMFSTNVCPWEVYINAVDIEEQMKKMAYAEKLKAIEEILKAVFIDLTSDDLKRADAGDVVSTFLQICNGGQKIKGGSSKN